MFAAIVALIISVIGTAASAYTQYSQAKTAEDEAEANAALAREQAQEAKRLAAYEETQRNIEGRRLLASQKAAGGASGATLGSFASVFAGTETDTALDVEAIRKEGLAKYNYYISLAEQYEDTAKNMGSLKNITKHLYLGGTGYALKTALTGGSLGF